MKHTTGLITRVFGRLKPVGDVFAGSGAKDPETRRVPPKAPEEPTYTPDKDVYRISDRHALLLVVLLAVFLRLFQLGTESLWIDEGYSIRDATETGRISLFRPLFYILLHFWLKLGHSEVWLRLPAVVFGVASVILLYRVAGRLFGHRTGILSSLLLSVSVLHINHSQEIRMYSLVTLVVLTQVYLFIRYMETASWRHLLACMASGVLAFLVFTPTVSMFMAFFLFMLLRIRKERAQSVRWLSAQTALLLPAIPLIPWSVDQVSRFGNQWSWGMDRPGFVAVISLIRDFNLWQIPERYHTVSLVGNAYGACVLGVALYGAVRVYRLREWQTAFALTWLFVPIGATVAVSYLAGNMWMVRYMIHASPALYMLVALGLQNVPRRWMYGVGLVAVFLPILLRMGVYYTEYQHPLWRPVTAYVQQNLEEGDAIAIYRHGNRYVFDYYYSGDAPFFVLGQKRLSREAVTGWSDERIRKELSVLPPDAGRVWFVLSYGENTGEYEMEDYILRHYQVHQARDYERIRVYLTSPK